VDFNRDPFPAKNAGRREEGPTTILRAKKIEERDQPQQATRKLLRREHKQKGGLWEKKTITKRGIKKAHGFTRR